MIKGCEKKIIFLESTKSKYFDQAYLVMKDDIYTCDEGEILGEAERIIFGAEGCKKPKKKEKGKALNIWRGILSFSFGLLSGLVLAFSLSLIIF
ncbi:MAG: hypothetical protein IJ437_05540 [Clostridia bacterium]|nr:hypothetical protein [Clostridia bacterium]